MRYISTRGEAPELSFCDVMLTGLASDGGLYMPREWPSFSKADIAAMRGLSYSELAVRLLRPFVGGEIDDTTFERIVNEAYSTFAHGAVCPLVQLDTNRFVLELFHGPTLAFKDVAMQLIGRLIDHVLTERGERAVIVAATSGDTGGAAIEAFAGRERADIFVLFPHNRVSPVQQRQMTTSTSANVHAIAVEGNFDDCQSLVKAMFSDRDFRTSVNLSGVNSINWARIMAQIVYYFSSALSLGAPERAVSFAVPTGNFGDVFAGYAAKRMGLDIERLVIATNENDILVRALESGEYRMRGVVPTTSPSMDIQVSSNFERLLFEASDRDSGQVKRAMDGLKQSGGFFIDPAALERIRADFGACRSTVTETADMIGAILKRSGYLLDPHTATAVRATARKASESGTPMVVLGTAHPSKFPDVVKEASGIYPNLPEAARFILDRQEKFEILPAELKSIETFILERSRASAEVPA